MRQYVTFWLIGALVLLALYAAGSAAQALLLLFMAILFGAALRGLAELVASRLHWRMPWSLVAVLAALALLSAGTVLWVAPHVVARAHALIDQLGAAYDRVRGALPESSLKRRTLDEATQLGGKLAPVLTRAAGILASVAGGLGAVVFIVFVAIYLASAPHVYVRGFVQLVPPSHRGRAEEILGLLGRALRRWLFGRSVSMLAVGVVTTLGLWIIGIPLPGTLGLLAGVLGFVPNIGPVVSAVPALLLALTQSPLAAAYVSGLYLAVNLMDGYLLTPWLQKRAVSVPPALILTSQVVLGAFWGVLGVMLATPLCACALIVVRELYVKDVLERH